VPTCAPPHRRCGGAWGPELLGSEYSDVVGISWVVVMFMLNGRISAKAGRRDELLQIMTEGAKSMPGCRLYVVAVDEAEADGVLAKEIWETDRGTPPTAAAADRPGSVALRS